MIASLNFAEKIENIWWSFDDTPFVLRTKPGQIYKERSGAPQRSLQSLKDECILAAQKIRDTVDGNIEVLTSGGIDSEVALQSFHEAKIPVTAVIAKFRENLNYHDIKYALDFCSSKSIKYKLIDIDIKTFLKDSVYEYAKILHTTSPQLCFHYWLTDQTDGYLVVGDGDLSLHRTVARDGCESFFVESYGEKWGMTRWMLHRQRKGCPKFYRYTAELEGAYLLDPTVQRFLKYESFSRKLRKLKFIKSEIFKPHFNTIPREKFNGFEMVSNECHQVASVLEAMYPESDSYYSIPLDILMSLKTDKYFNWDMTESVSLQDSLFDEQDILNFSFQGKKSNHYFCRWKKNAKNFSINSNL